MASSTKSEQQSPTHQTSTKTSPSSSSTTVSIANQQSPRNTSSGALPSGTYVSFGPVEVSKALQDGEKFVKWDDVSLHLLLFLKFKFYGFPSVFWKIDEIWF